MKTEAVESPKPMPGHTRRMIELWEKRTRAPSATPLPACARNPSVDTFGIDCSCSCHEEGIGYQRRAVADWPMSPPPATPPPGPTVRIETATARLQQPQQRAAYRILSRVPVPSRLRAPPQPVTAAQARVD